MSKKHTSTTPKKVASSFKIGTMGLIWLLNPVFVGGCDDKAFEFEFEAEDMIELVETIDDGSWTAHINGQDYQLEFVINTDLFEAELSQAGLSLGTAWACEQRSFVASAAACILFHTRQLKTKAV